MEACWTWRLVGRGGLLDLEGCWTWRFVGRGGLLDVEACWMWRLVGRGGLLDVDGFWTFSGWTLSGSSKYTSNNLPRMQNQRLLVQL
jgi:hypothetical protein